MASSFAKLKESRQKSFENITHQVEEERKKKSFSDPTRDDRFWNPMSVLKDGKGSAKIRFLMEPEGEDVFYVKYFHYFFRTKTGRVYGQNSLTTFGDTTPDPVYELNGRLFASGDEKSKDQALSQKRRVSFIANILVIDNPNNPSDNGKVFLFKFGKQIWEKIIDKMNPQFDTEEKIFPYDMWEGANMILNVYTTKIGNDDVPQYDKSTFEKPSAVASSEDKIEEIWAKEYPLAEFIDPTNTEMYKSYDQLKKMLNKALGIDQNVNMTNHKSDPEPEMDKTDSEPEISSKDDDEELDEFFKELDDEIPF